MENLLSKDIGDFKPAEVQQMKLAEILDLHEALDIVNEQKQYEQRRLDQKYGRS